MALLIATTAPACQGTQAIITLSEVEDAQARYYWTVISASGADYGGDFDPAQLPLELPVPDGNYSVRVYADYNGALAASTIRTYSITCAGGSGGGGGAGGGGGGCTLSVSILALTPPAVAGGQGQISYRIAGAADSFQFGEINRVSDGVNVNQVEPSGNGDYTAPIPANGVGVPLQFTVYEEAVYDSSTCQASITFTVPAFAPPPDPSAPDPARWEPVGGVLPNPVLLQVEAALTDGAGAARAGLHVEVQLWRPAAGAAFASFQATVRTATQYVDAAPYLRAELAAALRYPATSSAPLIDADAALRFYYQYRLVDRDGAEPWLTRAGERYAVLAALPGAADTMAAFVADGTGRVASIFPPGEAAQFIGYPLEVSVLLPPATAPRWAEWRYLNAYGQELEIRSYALPATLPAGVLRLPLPSDPLLAAASVEVAIVDVDRSYAGGGTPTPTIPGFLLTNTGRLQL